MSLIVTNEAWEILSGFINPSDRVEAADELVSMLIETGYHADDIRSEFTDKDIRSALMAYIRDHSDDDADWESDDGDDGDCDEDEEW